MYAAELCFLPDVVIHHKFKVPELEKNDDTTCPKSDPVMYCRKMAACTQDDKWLIYFFQDSLTGAASKW